MAKSRKITIIAVCATTLALLLSGYGLLLYTENVRQAERVKMLEDFHCAQNTPFCHSPAEVSVDCTVIGKPENQHAALCETVEQIISEDQRFVLEKTAESVLIVELTYLDNGIRSRLGSIYTTYKSNAWLMNPKESGSTALISSKDDIGDGLNLNESFANLLKKRTITYEQ